MILQLFRIYCAKSAAERRREEAARQGISIIVQFVGVRIMFIVIVRDDNGVGARARDPDGAGLSGGGGEEEEEGGIDGGIEDEGDESFYIIHIITKWPLIVCK